MSSSPCVSSPRGPTMTGSTEAECASLAPPTISSGPRSYPMASTATRTVTPLRDRRERRLDLAAAICLARRAHPVWALRPSALRAEVQARGFGLVLRAPLVPPRLRRFLLGDGHERGSVSEPCNTALIGGYCFEVGRVRTRLHDQQSRIGPTMRHLC